MKRKAVQFLCGTAMMAMALCQGGAVFAEESSTEAVTEAAAEESSTGAAAEAAAETEDTSEEETEEEKAPDVEVKEGDEVILVLDNQTGITFTGAELAEKELTLTEEDGTVHTIMDVDKEDIDLEMADAESSDGEKEEGAPALVKYGSFIALEYHSLSLDSSKRMVEEGEEITFEEPKAMYMLGDVYVHAEASLDSENIAVAGRGSEITVIGELPKWYHISMANGEGYLVKSYVTEEAEEADQAVKAEAQARAAQAAASSQGSQSGGGAAQTTPQGRYEVSRQAYDDCDGSGHGYYEITYSDGSVEIQEY